ncbi:MAG TPA: hypothetical protein VGG19_15475 [Tepidisphaeraceae bacterium]|jgi:prepilin-type processing-associated H-X9-DG protein
MIRSVIFACVICCVSLLTFAQPLADHVPSDAIAYLAWAGSNNIPAQSHLHNVLSASDASNLLTEFAPALAMRIHRNDPASAQRVEMFTAILNCLWKHPSAIYFTDVDVVSSDQMLPKMGILCDAGDDASALEKNFTQIIAMAGDQGAKFLSVKQTGDLVSFTVDHADANPATLADDSKFKDAMASVQANPAAEVYIDVAGTLTAVDQMVQANSPDSVATWKKIENASGLSRVKAIACTGAFDGTDWATECFFSLPGESAPAASDQLSNDTLKLIPRDASLCTAWEFNVGHFLDKIRARLATVDPQYQRDYDMGLGAASAMTGINVKTDFIDTLGDQWVTFSAPEVAGSSALGTVLINHLADADKAQHSLESIELALNNIVAGQLRHSDITVAVRNTQYNGNTIHYVAVPLISPAWTIVDGNLYFALYPQAVAGAVAFEKSGGESILDNPTFTQLRSQLKGEQCSMIKFADVPKTIDASYPVWLALSHYAGFADLFGVSSPPMLLPPIASIKKELSPVMSVGYWDQTGWHARSRSPFPGAIFFAGDPMTVSPIGTTALMTSILLPSLNRSRETANRIKCGSNMRQIGQAILLYSNEHNGKFPPDLGTLVLTEEISPRVFLCPSASSHLPAGFSTMSAEDQAVWVSKNSDYIYLGKGMNSSVNPDLIVLYEKDANHRRDGMNILFADGHVDFNNLAGAHQMIEKQLPGQQH